MNYSEIIEKVANQGAVRVCRMGGGWAIAYRMKNGEVQARSISKNDNEEWELSEQMAGHSHNINRGGWYPVQTVHKNAEPLNIESAKKNQGYFTGNLITCYTCKLEKPPEAFRRNQSVDQQYREWECNSCSQERGETLDEFEKTLNQNLGDSVKHSPHASKPPVPGEI